MLRLGLRQMIQISEVISSPCMARTGGLPSSLYRPGDCRDCGGNHRWLHSNPMIAVDRVTSGLSPWLVSCPTLVFQGTAFLGRMR